MGFGRIFADDFREEPRRRKGHEGVLGDRDLGRRFLGFRLISADGLIHFLLLGRVLDRRHLSEILWIVSMVQFFPYTSR